MNEFHAALLACAIVLGVAVLTVAGVALWAIRARRKAWEEYERRRGRWV